MSDIKDICRLEMARREFEYACWRSMCNDRLRRDKAHKRGAFSEKPLSSFLGIVWFPSEAVVISDELPITNY